MWEKYRAIAALGADLVVATDGADPEGRGQRVSGLAITETTDPERTAVSLTAKALRQLITTERPDLVHLELDPESRLAASAAAAARAAGIPYVLFARQPVDREMGWLSRRRQTATLEYAAGVAGESTVTMGQLRSVAPRAIAAVIPLAGVPVPPPLASEGRGPDLTVGFVGRLVPERGALDLIAALGRTFGRWRLIVVGTGPEQELLEREIQQRGLASRVEWRGGIRRDTTEALWREIDCLVAPSRDTAHWVEYHSPTVLDAMGHGVTPLVTRAGCLPDLVGEAGVIADDTEAMAATIQGWVADPASCRALGARARDRVLTRFVPSAVAAATLDFWRATVAFVAAGAPEGKGV